MTYKSIFFAGLLAAATAASDAVAQSDKAVPGEAGAPYANMNHIAPIGVRTGKYFDIPESAKGPVVDPAKGYRTRCRWASLWTSSTSISLRGCS